VDNESNIIEITEPVENDVFVVKQSFPVILIAGGFLFVMILSGVSIELAPVTFLVGIVLLVILVLGLRNKEAIRIDCNGIYQSKQLVTDWHHFAGAFISQAPEIGETADNFILIVRYFKEGFDGNFKMTIPLAVTQNKSEEEVLEAIERFHQLSLKAVTPLEQPLEIGKGS
jgi:hypothetical protein